MENNKLKVFRTQALSPQIRESYERALPETLRRVMGYDRALVTITRAMQRNPKLLDADPQSMIRTMIDCASLGLELGGPLNHAYPVPYKGQITLQLGYRGILELARRSGELAGPPIVQWVYARDEFSMNLADMTCPVRHVPYLDGDRGKPRLCYCIAKFRDGGLHVDFMTADDIDKHRDKYCRRGGQLSDPWRDAPLEMGRKTVLRRASKHWPISVDMARALEMDDRPIGENAIGEYAFDNGDVIDAETGEVNEPATGADRTRAAVEQQIKRGRGRPRKTDTPAEAQRGGPSPEPSQRQADQEPREQEQASPSADSADAPAAPTSRVQAQRRTDAQKQAELDAARLCGPDQTPAEVIVDAARYVGLQVSSVDGLTPQTWQLVSEELEARLERAALGK